jgi:predicted neuraminidase
MGPTTRHRRDCWLLTLALLGAAPPGLGAQPTAQLEEGYVPVGQLKYAWLPNLAKLTDGRILCAYTQGSAQRLDSIWTLSTPDAGKSWSQPVKVIDAPANAYIADPNILVVDKHATVFATVVPDTKPLYARSETWASTTQDGGKTWSKPWQVPMHRKYTSGKVHVPVKLADGTILMGYSWETTAEAGKPAGSESRSVNKAGVLLSRDGGKTWKAGGDVAVDQPQGADEPALVALRNGDIFMIVRTGGPRPYEVRSRDRGRTWTEPRPSRFDGHDTPSALLRLQDGAILRVWDNSPRTRHPLVASISTDECQTWSRPRTIAEPEPGKAPSVRTTCYPSIAQANEGTILIVWWETGTFGSRIGYARFNRAWLSP